MKNTKLLKTAAVFACVALLAGCTKTPEETKETEASVTTTEAEEETTIEGSSEVQVTENDSVFSIEALHSNWRAFIENFDDDGYFYSFNYDNELRVDNGNGTVFVYEMSNDGEITQTMEIDYDFNENTPHVGLTYEDFLRCPVFSYWGYNTTITFDDDISDGEYYGFVIAVSDDGTTLFARVGEPVVITNELLDEQDPDSFFIDYNGTRILLDFTARELERPDEGESYNLFTPDGNPVTVNDRLVIIPISADATITSNAADYGLSSNPGDNAMTSSDAWTHITEFNPRTAHIDNWYRFGAGIFPVVIEDGQVIEVYFRLQP